MQQLQEHRPYPLRTIYNHTSYGHTYGLRVTYLQESLKLPEYLFVCWLCMPSIQDSKHSFLQNIMSTLKKPKSKTI